MYVQVTGRFHDTAFKELPDSSAEWRRTTPATKVDSVQYERGGTITVWNPDMKDEVRSVQHNARFFMTRTKAGDDTVEYVAHLTAPSQRLSLSLWVRIILNAHSLCYDFVLFRAA